MKLLSAPASPFGRKCKMTIEMKNLSARVEILTADTAAATAPALASANPMGRIPVLLTDDGIALHDSHVICEYLDFVGTGPMLFPPAGAARWDALTRASLADGIAEAALLMVYEGRYRPAEMKVQSWLDRQAAKITASVDLLEKAPPIWTTTPDYGHVTLAAALGYLDFRHAGTWRAAHPKMVAWLNQFAAAVPAFAASAPPAA